MIRFLSDNGFNTYLYAPKDDPYHRAQWREDYPERLGTKLRELVQSCNLYSVNFIFSVSPGLSAVYSSKDDLNLLLKKLRSVIEMGAQWVGIMLDDIVTELHFEEDKKKFSSLGKAHAYFVNTVLDEISREKEGIRISFCPTYYANDYLGRKAQKNEYLFDIGSEMDKEIDVIWTGRYVVSPKITEDDAVIFENVVKRKPLLWDNYPVNDYFRSNEKQTGLRLNIGAFEGRSPRILEYISGYLSNPMNECEASKFPLLTLKDMLDDPNRYSPLDSLSRAIERLSSSLEVQRELKLLFQVAKASPMNPIEAEELRHSVQGVISSFQDGGERWKGSVTTLKDMLAQYHALRKQLKNELANRKLLSEIEPILEKIEGLADLGIATLYYLEEITSRKGGRDDEKTSVMRQQLEHKASTIYKLKQVQVMGEVDFGSLDSVSDNSEGTMSDLGLPYFKSKSPIIELYEWAMTLRFV